MTKMFIDLLCLSSFYRIHSNFIFTFCFFFFLQRIVLHFIFYGQTFFYIYKNVNIYVFWLNHSTQNKHYNYSVLWNDSFSFDIVVIVVQKATASYMYYFFIFIFFFAILHSRGFLILISLLLIILKLSLNVDEWWPLSRKTVQPHHNISNGLKKITLMMPLNSNLFPRDINTGL